MLDLKLWEEISEAARDNNVSTLKTLLSQRPSHETLNHGDPIWADRTPLHSASFNGHLEVVKLLVEAGANVHATDDYGNTPLHLASSKGHLEVAKLLVEAGANVDATNKDGCTPLHRASYNGHLEVAKLLVDAGAKTSNMPEHGSVALHKALSTDWFDVAELLIDAGASCKVIEGDKKFSVHHLLSNTNTRASTTFISRKFTLLTDAGATVDGATAKISPLVPSDVIRAIVPEDTPFWLAANNDAPKLAAELAGGLDPNTKTENGMTLLHWACAGDAPECVQLLLDAGADKEALRFSRTEIEDETSEDDYNYEQIVENLASRDLTPIFYCMHESSQCLENMINYGVNVNQSSEFDYQTKYPIHIALAANSPACVTALVGAGAWVTEEEMEDWCDDTLLESALKMRPVPVDALRALLAAAGERVLSEEFDGMPPLCWAVENSTVDVVRVLVEAGANVDATDKDGETPMQLALDYGRHEVAELLSEASKIRRAALKKAEEELRRQNAEQQAEIAKLQAAADERTALQRKIDELQAANSALTAQVARLQTETAQTKAELLAARPSSTSTVAELQRRLDRTQICLEMVKEERNEFIAKNAELMKQIQALEKA